MMSDNPPLILTLKLDAIAFYPLNQLRQQHFPPERNFLPAHVTLFHALPSDQEVAIRQTLKQVCSAAPPLPLVFTKVRFLGKGVAIDLDCPPLLGLRNQLAHTWHEWLTGQDQQGWRPHVTIQNKVAPDVARRLFDRLLGQWQPLHGQAEGLRLWRYQGGPWQWMEDFGFDQSNLRDALGEKI